MHFWLFFLQSGASGGEFNAKSGGGNRDSPAADNTCIGGPTYWTEAGGNNNSSSGNNNPASNMSRPSPSVSNCGLVIVQIDRQQQGQHQDAAPEDVYQPPPIVNW